MSLTIICSNQSWLIKQWLTKHVSGEYEKLRSLDLDSLSEYLWCHNLFNETSQIVIYDNEVCNNKTNYQKYHSYFLEMQKSPHHFYLVVDSLYANFAKDQWDVVELLTINEKNKLTVIQDICQQFHLHLDFMGMQMLNNKLIGDYGIIYYEIQKLTYVHCPITTQVIDELVCDYTNENIFYLFENLITGQTKSLLSIYQNLIYQKKDPFLIITTLTTQACQAYLIKRLFLKKQNAKTISNSLGLNFYVVSKMLNLLYNLNIDDLKTIIHNLGLLDVKIKRNNLNKELVLKLWLINESRKYGK